MDIIITCHSLVSSEEENPHKLSRYMGILMLIGVIKLRVLHVVNIKLILILKI